MIPCSFPESNGYYDRPENMPECEVLSTFTGKDLGGQLVVISCWKPTKEELEEINNTGRIWVWHFGTPLQPHAVTGTSPFQEKAE